MNETATTTETVELLDAAIREVNILVMRLMSTKEPVPDWAREAIKKADLLLNQTRDGLEDPETKPLRPYNIHTKGDAMTATTHETYIEVVHAIGRGELDDELADLEAAIAHRRAKGIPERTMHKFTFIVTVETETEAQARQVIAERTGYDEDLGFNYKVHDPRQSDLPESVLVFGLEPQALGNDGLPAHEYVLTDLLRLEPGDDTRSEVVALRTVPQGDLIIGVFPRGGQYLAIMDHYGV